MTAKRPEQYQRDCESLQRPLETSNLHLQNSEKKKKTPMLSRRWYREGNIRAESDTAAHNPTWTGGNSGEEGARWCAAVAAHFESDIKRSEAATVKESERTRLNILDPSHHRLI